MPLYFINQNLLESEDANKFVEMAEFIAGSYNLQSYNIEIELSKRLKTTSGNIKISFNGRLHARIMVSLEYYKEFGINRIVGTLFHEFAHMIAFIKTRSLDHSDIFKSICAELGGTMNPHMAETAFESSATTQFIRKPLVKSRYVYI